MNLKYGSYPISLGFKDLTVTYNNLSFQIIGKKRSK